MRWAEDCRALVNSLLVRSLVLEALVRPSPIYKAEGSADGKAVGEVIGVDQRAERRRSGSVACSAVGTKVK